MIDVRLGRQRLDFDALKLETIFGLAMLWKETTLWKDGGGASAQERDGSWSEVDLGMISGEKKSKGNR